MNAVTLSVWPTVDVSFRDLESALHAVLFRIISIYSKCCFVTYGHPCLNQGCFLAVWPENRLEPITRGTCDGNVRVHTTKTEGRKTVKLALIICKLCGCSTH